MLGRLRNVVNPALAGGGRGPGGSAHGGGAYSGSAEARWQAFVNDCKSASAYYAQGGAAGGEVKANAAATAFARVVDALLTESEAAAARDEAFLIGKLLEAFLERKVMEAVCLGVMSCSALGLGSGRCTPAAAASALSAMSRLVGRSDADALLPHNAVHRPLALLLERSGQLGDSVAAVARAAKASTGADATVAFAPCEELIALTNACASKLIQAPHLNVAFGGTERAYSMMLDVLVPFLSLDGEAGDSARTGLMRCLQAVVHEGVACVGAAPRVSAALAKALEAAVAEAATHAERAPQGVRCNHLDMSELEERWEYIIMVTQVTGGGQLEAVTGNDSDGSSAGPASLELALALSDALSSRLVSVCSSLGAGASSRSASWRRGALEAFRRLVVAACARGARMLGSTLVERLAGSEDARVALASCLRAEAGDDRDSGSDGADTEGAVALAAARLVEALCSAAAVFDLPAAERSIAVGEGVTPASGAKESRAGADDASDGRPHAPERPLSSLLDWWGEGPAWTACRPDDSPDAGLGGGGDCASGDGGNDEAIAFVSPAGTTQVRLPALAGSFASAVFGFHASSARAEAATPAGSATALVARLGVDAAVEGDDPASTCSGIPMSSGQADAREAYAAYLADARDALRRRAMAARTKRCRVTDSGVRSGTAAPALSTTSACSELFTAVSARLACALTNEPALNAALTAAVASLATSLDASVHVAVLGARSPVLEALVAAASCASETAGKVGAREWALRVEACESAMGGGGGGAQFARDAEQRMAAGTVVVKHACLELQATAAAKAVLMTLDAACRSA